MIGGDAGAGLRVAALRLSYPAPGGRHTVLDIDAFELPARTTAGIAGASGSGKTSLLHLLAGIDRPESGRIAWGADEITKFDEAARDRWRRGNAGLVFQDFHLVAGLNPRDNVLLAGWLDHFRAPAAMQARAEALLRAVGLVDIHRPVASLSRGEQQRVAVARALLRRPRVVLADEPTASLDPAAGRQVADLLLTLCGEVGATLVVMSHDPALLQRMQRRYVLDNGRLEPAP